MESRRYLDCLQRTLPSRAAAAGVLIGLLVSPHATSRAEQSQLVGSRDSAIPTLDQLQSNPLPRGFFKGWCGLQDRVLMEVDQKLELYEAGRKLSALSVAPSKQTQCNEGGNKLVFVDDRAGRVSELDVLSGTIRSLATYEKQKVRYPRISFSPDIKSIATDRPLSLATDAADLHVVQLSAPEGGSVRRIEWSSDSSKFFVVSESKGATHSPIVEIFSPEHQKIASGVVPAGFLFRDGWFANSQTLHLYLGSADDEFGSGAVFSCNIQGWKCDQIIKDVESASLGGRELMATVRGVGKPSGTSGDGDYQTLPPRYVVELQSGKSIMARQTFASAERPQMRVAVAPSGTKTVLIWAGTLTADCPREKAAALCEAGTIINLARSRK
jgi:hypothetical protein